MTTKSTKYQLSSPFTAISASFFDFSFCEHTCLKCWWISHWLLQRITRRSIHWITTDFSECRTISYAPSTTSEYVYYTRTAVPPMIYYEIFTGCQWESDQVQGCRPLFFCFKSHRLGMPSFWASCLRPYINPTRTLLSYNRHQLTVLWSWVKLIARNFSDAVSQVWNELLTTVRASVKCVQVKFVQVLTVSRLIWRQVYTV